MQQSQKHLLQLISAKQNSDLHQIKKGWTQYGKYFFNLRRNITIGYDKSALYVVHKDYLKIIDLGKVYIITDIAYNYQKHIAVFLTTQGHLYAHFASSKTQILIKKDFKKLFVMEWIYSVQQTANLFIAEQSGIHLYKLQQDKKTLKQVKHLSGKYHCYLYEPLTEFLVGFQYGQCDVAYIFHFDQQKAKNWFRCGEIQVNFTQDQTMEKRIKTKKNFGLEGSRINKQIFLQRKDIPQDFFIDIQRIHGTPYMFFYYSNEGKLQLTPLAQSQKKQVTIKLPSDSLPSFNIFDNMLVVHLRNQKITFIYDINATNFQALVSPYPLTHQNQALNSLLYSGQFMNKRVILPGGQISKWKISLPVIYHYLKSQMYIFQFLHRRNNSKMQIVRWMRENLFNFKPISLSKMWKLIFTKLQSYLYDQSETISLIQIYTNLFFTLSIDPLVNRQALTNILIECIRQANEFHLAIPDQFQILTTEMLLSTQKYELLTYLCHQTVINCHQKIFKLIFEKGFKQNSDLLVTLSIDLTYQAMHPKQVLRMIMKTQRVREGKRYIKSNYQKMEALDILEVAKYITNLEVKKQFMGYARLFILKKYPSVNPIYLDEAQSKLIT